MEAAMSAVPVPPDPAAAPEPAPLSEGARIIDTFIAPSKTFTDLRRNSSWWAPWLLISLVSIIFIMVIGKQIGYEQISRNQIAHSSRADQFDKLPADQQARQLHVAAAVTKYIGFAFPVIILISFLLMAVVLLATFNLGAGAAIRFGTALAIVCYGSLPGIIHAILGMGSLFAGVDRDAYNINNPVATNPAYFMDPAGSKFIYGMASAVDIFAIWNIILMGIGFACNSKVKRSTAILIVAAWYIFYKLVGSGMAAMFS
jgi:Yip1-like protein